MESWPVCRAWHSRVATPLFCRPDQVIGGVRTPPLAWALTAALPAGETGAVPVRAHLARQPPNCVPATGIFARRRPVS